MNKKLYHFTTLDSYNKIESDGFIRASSSGKYGPGVYLTDLHPNEHSDEKISQALYNAGAEKNLRAGKLDHHFCFKMSESHVKEERPHVYRYVGGNELCLSRHRVISRGLIQEFGSGLMIAAAAVTAGAALYSHATDRRMARTQELKTTLKTFLRSTAATSKFIPVVSEDGGSVQVCCSECSSSPVSDVYEGGYLFSSTIDEKQLQEQLRKHEMFHRTQELKTTLKTFLRINAPLKFIPVVSKNGEAVQVACTMCNSPVSAVYRGGHTFTSTIDLEQLQEQLRKHERFHRTQELKMSLQAFLRNTAAPLKFIPVVSKNGESVQVVCTMFSSPVSAVYKGGHIFPSTIDLEQLQEQLWKHEKMHLLKRALFAGLTVGCIYYAPVFSCLLGLGLLGLALLDFTIATNLLRI